MTSGLSKLKGGSRNWKLNSQRSRPRRSSSFGKRIADLRELKRLKRTIVAIDADERARYLANEFRQSYWLRASKACANNAQQQAPADFAGFEARWSDSERCSVFRASDIAASLTGTGTSG